jgi:hypothetical protein
MMLTTAHCKHVTVYKYACSGMPCTLECMISSFSAVQMMYDNPQLANTYLAAFQACADLHTSCVVQQFHAAVARIACSAIFPITQLLCRRSRTTHSMPGWPEASLTT